MNTDHIYAKWGAALLQLKEDAHMMDLANTRIRELTNEVGLLKATNEWLQHQLDEERSLTKRLANEKDTLWKHLHGQ